MIFLSVLLLGSWLLQTTRDVADTMRKKEKFIGNYYWRYRRRSINIRITNAPTFEQKESND